MRRLTTPLPELQTVDSLSTELVRFLDEVRLESDSTYIVNNSQFHTQKITGRLNDKKMYYMLSVISSEGEKFQLTGWMFNDKRPLWEADFDDMLHSWQRL